MQQSVIDVKHQKPGIYYVLNTDYCFKKLHFKTVCKDNSGCITQLKQQQEGQHPLTGQCAANFRLLANH